MHVLAAKKPSYPQEPNYKKGEKNKKAGGEWIKKAARVVSPAEKKLNIRRRPRGPVDGVTRKTLPPRSGDAAEQVKRWDRSRNKTERKEKGEQEGGGGNSAESRVQ